MRTSGYRQLDLKTDFTLLNGQFIKRRIHNNNNNNIDKAWSDQCAELSQASCRLSQICAQEALILLWGSFSAPKVLHLLRCSPSASHSALPEFDKLLRLAVERITISSLTDTSGFKPVCRLKMAVLLLGVCHRPPFLPIWLWWRAPLCSKLRSWPIAMFRKILTGRTIYSCGRVLGEGQLALSLPAREFGGAL